MPFGVDPVLLVVLAFVLLVILGGYLFVRRATTAYRDGAKRGRR